MDILDARTDFFIFIFIFFYANDTTNATDVSDGRVSTERAWTMGA